MIGIVSYGFYIPKHRIKTESIAMHWKKDPTSIIASLGVVEKTVGNVDEDVLTMAYESSTMALKDSNVEPSEIRGVFVGSENHPYVVNPTSTILAEYLNIGNNYLAYDTQFACKAATGALISGLSLVKSGFGNNILIVGSDKATGKPGDSLEYSAGSASGALLLGNKKVLLEYIDATSFSSDIPDFWRRDGNIFPSHAGRFSGKPGYFHHITSSVNLLLKRNKLSSKDFKYAIFHSPNGIFPIRVGLSLGFTPEQIKQSLVVKQLGNPYSASTLIGLCAVLEHARAGDLILIASYGSGAGSDAFIFRVTKHLKKHRKKLSTHLKNKEYIDYITYLKYMGI